MKAQVKLNPTRLRLPKYGNALMLLMELASRHYTPVIKKVTQNEETFDIEIYGTKAVAQSFKKYINDNL